MEGPDQASALEPLILEKLRKYGGVLRADRLRDLLISHTHGTGPNRVHALKALAAKGQVTLIGLRGTQVVCTTLCVLVPKST